MAALECRNLSKSFRGLEAIKDVTLSVEEGERRAIIGPNGAGKTTFFKLISGQYRVGGGNIRLFGRDITELADYKRASLGLGRTFQITNLFPSLSALDSLILAQMGLELSKFSMLKPLRFYRRFYTKANEMLESMDMLDQRSEVINSLSYGSQRQIEIGMALIVQPKILLLDEPTAGLSPAESKRITEIIAHLDSRITILLIEHDMDVAFQITDYITVLHLGEIFAEGTKDQIKGNMGVQEIYLGKD